MYTFVCVSYSEDCIVFSGRNISTYRTIRFWIADKIALTGELRSIKGAIYIVVPDLSPGVCIIEKEVCFTIFWELMISASYNQVYMAGLLCKRERERERERES